MVSSVVAIPPQMEPFLQGPVRLGLLAAVSPSNALKCLCQSLLWSSSEEEVGSSSYLGDSVI